MRFGSSKSKAHDGAESRRAKRHHTNLLSCELGDVADISATGMRVKCPVKPPVRVGQAVGMKLESAGQRLPVEGRVVWIQRKGLKSYQVGVKFLNLSASVSAALESLALFGFIDTDAAAAAKRRNSKEEPDPVGVSMDLPDYYKVLGLRRRAPAREIKRAYRVLALQNHPDVTKDPDAMSRFIKIKEAYEVLRDPRRRKSYDARLTK